MIHVLQPEDMSDEMFIKAITLEENVDGIEGQLRLALPGGENSVFRVVERDGKKVLQSRFYIFKTKEDDTSGI